MKDRIGFGIHSAARLAVALLALSACTKGPAAASDTGGRAGPSPDIIIAGVRAELFKGPIRSLIDVDQLDPGNISPDSRLGITARWNSDREIAMAYIRAAGIKWLRLGIDDDSQAVLDLAKRYDLKVLAQLGYGPVMEMAPKELAAWYLQKSIPLIRKNRSVIAAVQIWNEPFNFPKVDAKGKRAGAWPTRYGGRWFGGAYIEPFADFTNRVASGLRKEFPDLVLIGGTRVPGSTLEMIKEGKPPLDAVYLQPYPRKWPPELLRVLNDPVHTFSSDYQLRSAVDAYLDKMRRAADKPDLRLWITEIGATTYQRDKNNRNYPHPPVSEELQAKLYARIWAAYMSADVDRLFYFLLNDKSRNAPATKPERHFAIVDSGWRPKPAYFVLARLNALTGGEVQADSSISWRFEGDAKFAKSKRRSLPAFASITFDYKPELQVRGFATGKGWKMVAIWSDATFPTDRELYESRNIRIGLDGGFRCEAIIVDPLSGDSRIARVDDSGDGGWIQLAVRDYPILILTTQSDDKCSNS